MLLHLSAIMTRLDVKEFQELTSHTFTEQYTALVQRLSLMLLQVRHTRRHLLWSPHAPNISSKHAARLLWLRQACFGWIAAFLAASTALQTGHGQRFVTQGATFDSAMVQSCVIPAAFVLPVDMAACWLLLFTADDIPCPAGQ